MPPDELNTKIILQTCDIMSTQSIHKKVHKNVGKQYAIVKVTS